MKFRHFTELRTDFDTEECRRRLVDSIDREKSTIFSFSGYKGSKPVIGRVDGYQFCLHKRRYWRNDFAPEFHGNLLPKDGATIIEGYFDMPRWPRIFMRVWTVIAILFGTPAFVLSLSDLLRGTSFVGGPLAVGLLVPPGMVLFGFFLPRLGLWLGRYEEQFILEFLQHSLFAAANPK